MKLPSHLFPRGTGVAWRARARPLILAGALVAALALAALAGAASASAAGPTATHTPTATPTHTPAPTATDRPYPTQVPYPTQIPYPTQAPPSPALALSQAQGVTGTGLLATATNFPPNTTVSLYWDKSAAVVGRDAADDTGYARIDVTIPRDASVGGHTIRAVGANHTTAAALFTVTRPQGAVVDAGGSGSSTYCTGLLGWCPDLGGLIGSVAGAVWDALTSNLASQVQGLSDAILGPLTHTPDLRANQELTRVQGVLSQDASEAVVVLLGIAAMWCAAPRFFGSVTEGVSLLWRSALVIATLRTLNPICDAWFALANALAGDVGHVNAANVPHSGLTLILSPVFLVLAGLERQVSLYTLGLCYVVAPVFIALFIWPPAHRLASAWLMTFLSTSTLGLAYSIASVLIVAMTEHGEGIWSDISLLGGLFFLVALPVIWAALTISAVNHGSGALSKVVSAAAMAAA